MAMLYVLIPLAVVLLGIAVWAMLWAIRSGQFDDLDSHGWSVVLDDDQKPPPVEEEGANDAEDGAEDAGDPAGDNRIDK